jgi:hypothetical protein
LVRFLKFYSEGRVHQRQRLYTEILACVAKARQQ